MADDKQNSLDGFEPDAKRYREASQPHESVEAAQKAMDAFVEGVAELRVKHRVKDFLAVFSVAILDDDGEEGKPLATFGYGSRITWEPMAAYLYGREKADHERHIADILKGKATR